MNKQQFFALILCSFCLLPLSQAQIKFGLRGGISTTDLDANELLITNRDDFESLRLGIKEAKYGIHFGLFTRIHIKKFFIQPEVIFNTSEVSFESTELGQPSRILEERYNNLDIPLTMGFKFGPLRLQGGPVAHVLLNSKSDLFDIQGYDQTFDNMTIGYQIGGGFDIGKVLLDFRYEGNFNNFGEHINFGDQSYAFDDKPGRLIFSLGYMF